jgi:aryl-alcohol dehydrogenase-like predicted oxidoreductase
LFGVRLADFRQNYQDGESESWIGEWMEKKKNRDFMVIATKFTTGYNIAQEGRGKTVNHVGNHKRSLHMSLRDSLAKLKTDWIDILYVHW